MENKFSEGLTKVFKQSKSEAKRLHSEFLSTEHFLLGIIQTDNSAKEILENLQADLTQIRRKIENIKQIRVINLIGCIAFVIYGVFSGMLWPIIIPNAILCVIQLYHLIKHD